jgi:hypothetical protein
MYGFLINIGTTEMGQIVGYAQDTISDISPVFLLVVGVSIALLVIGGIISMAKK